MFLSWIFFGVTAFIRKIRVSSNKRECLNFRICLLHRDGLSSENKEKYQHILYNGGTNPKGCFYANPTWAEG